MKTILLQICYMTAGRWIKPDSAVSGFDSPVTHCISRELERVVTGINIHHPMQLNKFKFERLTELASALKSCCWGRGLAGPRPL